ncbi:MAG: hypothetical protein KGZ30_03435 [Anaplasmataceae bacterium]|nr:hypothetical protein [Anaplasmataceae bacterium]
MENYKDLSDFLQVSVASQTAKAGPPRAFSDADLSQLREQIKRIMIPKLIRVFELKLAAQQAVTPPSRLTSHRPDSGKLLEIQEELSKLSEDLKLLRLWVDSCQNQVSKAMDQVQTAMKTII